MDSALRILTVAGRLWGDDHTHSAREVHTSSPNARDARALKEQPMKIMASFVLAASLLVGCASTGTNNPHADGEAPVQPDSGPTLCKDGTTPPCNIRD